MILEQFLIEYREIKKELLCPITTDANSAMNQLEFKGNTCHWCQTRGNACKQVTFCFYFVSHWLKTWREFVNQSERRKAKSKQTRNYFHHSTENRSYILAIGSKLKRYLCFSSTLLQFYTPFHYFGLMLSVLEVFEKLRNPRWRLFSNYDVIPTSVDDM